VSLTDPTRFRSDAIEPLALGEFGTL